VRWELEWSFDGQLCHKCLHQKLLKSINPSSSQSIMLGMFFDIFLLISTHVLLVQFFPGSSVTDIG